MLIGKANAANDEIKHLEETIFQKVKIEYARKRSNVSQLNFCLIQRFPAVLSLAEVLTV